MIVNLLHYFSLICHLNTINNRRGDFRGGYFIKESEGMLTGPDHLEKYAQAMDAFPPSFGPLSKPYGAALLATFSCGFRRSNC